MVSYYLIILFIAAMPNLRIITDNAADRATITASSTAGSLVASNLQNNLKGQAWRAAGTTGAITLVWPSQERVGCVGLPFANFTSSATIRVRGYTLSTDSAAVFDTGVALACPPIPFGSFAWGTSPLGFNAYNNLEYSYGNIWFTPISVQKLVIDLIDNSSIEGYMQIGRLITGQYWSPVINAEYGVQLSVVDTSKHNRTDAGDLVTDTGTKSRKISISLANMAEADRSLFVQLLQVNGLVKPIYFSLFPQATDKILEQTYLIYGKLSSLSAMTMTFLSAYSAPIEIEEL